MRDLQEMIRTAPLNMPKSIRRDNMRVLTSGDAGKIIPIAYVPLLREDRVSAGRMRISVEMQETVEMLVNSVHVTAHAYFVPYLASDRFMDMGHLNRVYQGEPEQGDVEADPFFEQRYINLDNPFYKSMGIHYGGKAGGPFFGNGFVNEAYNLVVNHRRKARSNRIEERVINAQTLAEAFWHHSDMAHIVPDFDDAMIDGAVKVNWGDAPIKGLWGRDDQFGTDRDVRRASGIDPATGAVIEEVVPQWPVRNANIDADSHVWAEVEKMTGRGLTLTDIDLAKQTKAFAEIRRQYEGLDDDYIIELLMQGIRVPEEAMSQPILLDRKTNMFGYERRFATDSGNLDKSVTSGVTAVDLMCRVPPQNTGGIILITAEIVPEQLFERKKDYYLSLDTTDALPNALRDFLDPQKVDLVRNDHVDTTHTNGDGLFGYAPLNHMWQRDHVRLGGKFQRLSEDDAWTEDRSRIWAAQVEDPLLTTDFYIVSDLHKNIFADTVSDSFEISATGSFTIVGNTVFGKGLQESEQHHKAIASDVDSDIHTGVKNVDNTNMPDNPYDEDNT